MKKLIKVLFKDGTLKEYKDVPEVAEALDMTPDSIRYILNRIKKGDKLSEMRFLKYHFSVLGVESITVEERTPQYKLLSTKELSKKYRKYVDSKMTPEAAVEYYTNIYGGNWKYSEKYKCVVSDEGLIASLNKTHGLLSISKNNNGYVRSGVTTLHKMVWETFNGEVPLGYDVDHIDNNKDNNKLSNLQLLTHRENCRKRDLNGSVFNKRVYCFLDGKLYKSFPSQADAANWIMETGQAVTDNPVVVRVGINVALTNKTTKKFNKPKKSYGYQWSYKDRLED